MEVSSCFPERFLKLVGSNVNNKEICSNVPKTCQLLIFISILRVSVPINVPVNVPKGCQLFNLASQGVPIFHLGVLRCQKGGGGQFFKFLEYLGNFKEKTYQHKIFNFVFNGERGIN